MRIALIGYGRMGKEIERVAADRQVTVAAKVDSKNPDLSPYANEFDVAIHFANAESVVPYVQQCGALKKNIVVGTTGWSQHIGKVWSIVQSKNIGLVHASNFSIGVNTFFDLLKHAAKLFDKFPEYDVYVQEVHHKDKTDSPSGTALTIAEILMHNIKRKKEILSTPPAGKIRPEQLHISSSRAGSVVGLHQVSFDSFSDSIEIKHTAKNRSGFALGALLAAEWINGKQGMFTMEDVMSNILS